MVLAAGLGTRLRPLTNDRPKALVEIRGRSLLEITLTRLKQAGVREVIINVHHFADMILDHLKAKDNFGLAIEISREPVLLDTGGGLKKAAYFFLGDREQPFILHNVDVISTIDLKRMVEWHTEAGTLATLAVQARSTARYLLFDERLALCGRRKEPGDAELVRPAAQVKSLAFCGIHVISPRLLTRLEEDGAFSIIQSYLRLAAQGETILGSCADRDYWRDLGRLENLEEAARDFGTGWS
jgi:NDP-sugar pyrophosphorylase family protein